MGVGFHFGYVSLSVKALHYGSELAEFAVVLGPEISCTWKFMGLSVRNSGFASEIVLGEIGSVENK